MQRQRDGTVEVVAYLGADTFVLLDCGAVGHRSVRLFGETDLPPGDRVGPKFGGNRTVFFDVGGGGALS